MSTPNLDLTLKPVTKCNCVYCQARLQELNICDRCGYIAPGTRPAEDNDIIVCDKCKRELQAEYKTTVMP